MYKTRDNCINILRSMATDEIVKEWNKYCNATMQYNRRIESTKYIDYVAKREHIDGLGAKIAAFYQVYADRDNNLSLFPVAPYMIRKNIFSFKPILERDATEYVDYDALAGYKVATEEFC